MEQGVVVEEETEQPERRHRVGRSRTALRLVPQARHAVGVHVGVNSVRVAVADLYARPLNCLSLTLIQEKPARETLTATAELIQEVVVQSGASPRQVVGVGVGASGLVNPHSGVNAFAPNLEWRDVPMRDWLAVSPAERLAVSPAERLAERLQLPVCVDNNVRAMVLGEALFDAGQDVRALAFVYARIGVGAGFVVDDRLYRGSGAGAGEHWRADLEWWSEQVRAGARWL